MWPYLLVAWCGAMPIYNATSDNPWDELRNVFYVRRFSNGDIYEHDVSLDSPPWTTWAPFHNDEKFYGNVVAKLDAFLGQTAEQVEKQPTVRRAIMMRDLWPVFEAQAKTDLTDAGAERRAELRRRLSKVMRRLELTEDEAQHLPNNFQAALDEKLFATEFDPAAPERGFLPADLLDEAGPWVAFGRSRKAVPEHAGAAGAFVGALHHLHVANYRSIFVPYIRVSADRRQTLDYLKQPETLAAVPPGTLLALVRHTALPTASGRVVITPIMESLQLIVVAPPKDQRFKFVLDRAELIAGRPGLRMLSERDPIDAYSVEAGGHFLKAPSKYDSDGEMLVFGRMTGRPTDSSLANCTICHGPTVGTRLFANTLDGIATPMTREAQSQAILSFKEKSASWGLYRDLHD
jgi:hypothetical protein